MTSLQPLLDSWETDLHAAQEMTVFLSQLGMPDEHMPSAGAIRAGCLALQLPESIERLRQVLLPREQELLEQLHISRPVRTLRAGEMMVLHHVIDKLDIIKEQINSMLERAYNFVHPDSPMPGYPTIKIPKDKVEGHRYQLVELIVKMKGVDRLLIYEAENAPRVVIFPPESLRVTLPIIEGELLLYAENTQGSTAATIQFSEVKYG